MMENGKKSLKHKQVVEYLMANPQFFTTPDPDLQKLIMELRIPADDAPNTISLLDYQGRKWRQRAEEAEELQKFILADQKYNLKIVKDINQAVLKIIACESLGELCVRLKKVFLADLALADYKLALFGEAPESPHYEMWDVSSLPQEVHSLLSEKLPAPLQLSAGTRELFFGKTSKNGDTDNYKSFLLAPLQGNTKHFGVICLASKDALRFSTNLLTDYVDFLFKVISNRLEFFLRVDAEPAKPKAARAASSVAQSKPPAKRDLAAKPLPNRKTKKG